MLLPRVRASAPAPPAMSTARFSVERAPNFSPSWPKPDSDRKTMPARSISRSAPTWGRTHHRHQPGKVLDVPSDAVGDDRGAPRRVRPAVGVDGSPHLLARNRVEIERGAPVG